MGEAHGLWRKCGGQMTRLRSASLGLGSSGYDPTRRRGTQMSEGSVVICYS